VAPPAWCTLRRAPGLAAAIAAGLASASASSPEVAQQAWQTLWSAELVRKQAIYRFGLEKLMRFSHAELCHFFDTFFHLPKPQWTGFLANTLTVPQLVQAMLGLFGQAPSDVRLGLMLPQGKELALAWRALAG
jgi:lycopene beta-cyclase